MVITSSVWYTALRATTRLKGGGGGGAAQFLGGAYPLPTFRAGTPRDTTMAAFYLLGGGGAEHKSRSSQSVPLSPKIIVLPANASA